MTNQSSLIAGIIILTLPGVGLLKNRKLTNNYIWVVLSFGLVAGTCAALVWIDMLGNDAFYFLNVVAISLCLKSTRLLYSGSLDGDPQPLINIPASYRVSRRKTILWYFYATALVLFNLTLFIFILGLLSDAPLI